MCESTDDQTDWPEFQKKFPIDYSRSKQERMALGLLALAELGGTEVSCERGILYAGGPDPVSLKPIRAVALAVLGWDWNAMYDSWSFSA